MKIKILEYALLLNLMVSCTQEKSHPIISLNKGWKFKLGDSTAWASPTFNDDRWDSVLAGDRSAGKIFDSYNGYAWYRIKTFIPSQLKKEAFIKDSLKIYLGAIDDCDQVYLNGELIGENTIVKKPNDSPNNSFAGISGLWNTKRQYILSVDDKRILWDKENVISIRMFDQYGGGGMYSSIPFLSMVGLPDYLIIDTDRFYKLINNNYVDKIVVLKNKSSAYLIDGTLCILAKNTEANQVLYKKDFNLKLLPGESKETIIELPVSTDPVKITFTVSDSFSKMQTQFTDSIPYILTK